jgi:hypothetical protein
MTVRERIIKVVSLATLINYPSDKLYGDESPRIVWRYQPDTNEFSVIISEKSEYTRFFVNCTKHNAYEELGEIIEKLKIIKEGQI